MKMKHEVENQPPSMYYVWGEQGPLKELNGKKHLISAGVAWENPNKDTFNAWTPEDSFIMVDSGGFQAATKWENHRYPYTAEELFNWAEKIDAGIVAGMDVACETKEKLKEIPSCEIEPLPIEERLQMSLENQIRQHKVYKEGNWDFFFMPVIQGNTVEQYKWFTRQLLKTGIIQRHGIVGIGSTCKRDSKEKILEITEAVNELIPDNTKIHLFGATINVWKDPRFWGLFDSSDTAAWKKANGFAENKEEKREFLKEYNQKVEKHREEIKRPNESKQLTEYVDLPTCQLVYEAKRGNLEAMEKLGEMGIEEV